jgi:hypothetical protein
MRLDGQRICEICSAQLDQVRNIRSLLVSVLTLAAEGGWCQMVEIYYQAQSSNGTLTERMSSEADEPWVY